MNKTKHVWQDFVNNFYAGGCCFFVFFSFIFYITILIQ